MSPENNDNNMKQELTLKQFCTEVAEARRINPHNVYMNMRRGVWPWPELKRKNQRVILVKTSLQEYLSSLSSYKSVRHQSMIQSQSKRIRKALQDIADLTNKQRTEPQSEVMTRLLKGTYELEQVFK